MDKKKTDLLKRALKLYAVTDDRWTTVEKSKEESNARTEEKEITQKNLIEQVEEALKGGVTMVQFREKNKSYEEKKRVALELQKLCKKYNVPFIINDNVELAKEICADGVHLGQSDMDVEEARKILGEEVIIGATAKTVEQARLAQEKSADYLGSGAVFGTTTKLDASFLSREKLTEICESVEIPVVAIGGITGENVAELSKAPIAGVAVVGGIFAQENIQAAAEKFCEIMKEW